jgi:hypothetical protein
MVTIEALMLAWRGCRVSGRGVCARLAALDLSTVAAALRGGGGDRYDPRFRDFPDRLVNLTPDKPRTWNGAARLPWFGDWP